MMPSRSATFVDFSMSSSAEFWGVVVAAGRGERFGAGGLKQFVPLAGKPLALWPIEALRDHPASAGLSIVVPPATLQDPPDWLADLAGGSVRLCSGGATRTDSVRAGLEAADAVPLVVVQDAARPLITRGILDRVLDEAEPDIGAIAARRASDTLKRGTPDGYVAETVDRTAVWRAETPQAFGLELLREIHGRALAEGVSGTDCAALCERYGIRVRLVELSEPNLKVTRPSDLGLVECVLEAR